MARVEVLSGVYIKSGLIASRVEKTQKKYVVLQAVLLILICYICAVKHIHVYKFVQKCSVHNNKCCLCQGKI